MTKRQVVILGVFVADTAYRADRMPKMGETLLGNSFALGPGGKGSNQAVAASRMGADVAMITKLGDDDFAKMALGIWAEAGVTPKVTHHADSYTGAAFIYVNEATGDNAIIIAPGAAATISSSDIEAHRDLIENASVFMTQLEQPLDAALKALEIAKSAGVLTILNPAPAAELPDMFYPLCDYITPNETETETLTGLAVETEEDAARACEAFVAKGVKTPIITLGERGVYLHGHGIVPAVKAGSVVETTGAGDAFNGGFASALSVGEDVLKAVQTGCATAGVSVTRPGAAASMPTATEVESLLSRQTSSTA